MNNGWRIGDGVIVRGEKRRVRVMPGYDDNDERIYTVSERNLDGEVFRYEKYGDLILALYKGQEWLP